VLPLELAYGRKEPVGLRSPCIDFQRLICLTFGEEKPIDAITQFSWQPEEWR